MTAPTRAKRPPTPAPSRNGPLRLPSPSQSNTPAINKLPRPNPRSATAHWARTTSNRGWTTRTPIPPNRKTSIAPSRGSLGFRSVLCLDESSLIYRSVYRSDTQGGASPAHPIGCDATSLREQSSSDSRLGNKGMLPIDRCLVWFSRQSLQHCLVRIARGQVSVDVLNHRERCVAEDVSEHDRVHPLAKRPSRVRVA